MDDYKKRHQEKMREKQREEKEKKQTIDEIRSQMLNRHRVPPSITIEHLRIFDIPYNKDMGTPITFAVAGEGVSLRLQLCSSHTIGNLRKIVDTLKEGKSPFQFISSKVVGGLGFSVLHDHATLEDAGIEENNTIIIIRQTPAKFP